MGWTTLGQDHILNRLALVSQRKREAHAYLLTGPPHVGKLTLANDLAQAVNCTDSHSDTARGPKPPVGTLTKPTIRRQPSDKIEQ